MRAGMGFVRWNKTKVNGWAGFWLFLRQSADSCFVFLESYCETWFYTGQTNAETRSWGREHH